MTTQPQSPKGKQAGKRQIQVVPPKTAPTQNGRVNVPPEQPRNPPPKPPSSSSPYQIWFVVGTIVVVLGAISQIRVNPSVRAEAWLQPDPQAREKVYAPAPGVITHVLVQPDQSVEQGQPLALVESEELAEEVEAFNLRNLEVQAEVGAAQQNVLTAQARVWEIEANLHQAEHRLTEIEQEMGSVNTGSPPPEIQSHRAKIRSLQARVSNMERSIERYKLLEKQGVVPPETVDSLEREKLFFESEMEEVFALQAAAVERIEDEWKRSQDQVIQLQNSYRVALQDYQAAQNLVMGRVPVQEQLEQQTDKRVQQEQERGILSAPIAGTVVTQDLYALKGRGLQKGDEVLEITDPKQLVAVIEVKQEDRDLVEEGALVTFYPPEPKLKEFTTEIETIVTVLEPDAQLNRSVLRVVAKVGSERDDLQPGARVYAKIASPEQITLGQQAWRQVLNLFKVRKYS
jgi:biotin carboxyl carrier protein